MSTVKIRTDRCKGCGLCADACPKKIIVISNERMNDMGYHPAEVIDQEKCSGCASCAIMCPDSALEVYK